MSNLLILGKLCVLLGAFITVVLNLVCISVSYLMYGPYGSFAPTYDSSKATITKEQSDLLYSTYGDDTGIHYAKRLVRRATVMRKISTCLALASDVFSG